MSLEHSPAREAKVGRMLVSDQETADILGCSRATVWRRVRDGELPKPIKLGSMTRFVMSEIDEVVERAKEARYEAEA